MTEVDQLSAQVDLGDVAEEDRVKLLVVHGMSLFELGDVVRSVQRLSLAVELASGASTQVRFQAALALFSRESQFQTPDEALPALSRLRQMATSLGEPTSLGGLHFVVARLEALRGHCVDAHRHLDIGRRLLRQTDHSGLRSSVELVDSGLETYAGNLSRASNAARAGLEIAEIACLMVTKAGCLLNLGAMTLFSGHADRARTYEHAALQIGNGLKMLRFSAFDNLAQADLHEGKLESCRSNLAVCDEIGRSRHFPARSWDDLAHQITRCAYHERLEDWQLVINICDEADGELARRQYKAVRTALLCAKARALARIGDVAGADNAIATAVRVCPRGAVDPLIVLEASKAVCLGVQGTIAKASTHFDRALAACRAIGHRYHEGWIARQQKDILKSRDSVSVREQPLDTSTTGLLLNDVSTILGAGHSIDLLAHRVMSILKNTALANRLSIEALSGCEFQAEPSATVESGVDGAFTLQVRGSDRQLTIRVKSVESLDEISLLKGVTDVVQAAINRTADTESEDDDQNLWPRTMLPGVDDMVFRSPRMQEILRVAVRLASTELPVLITGETGTGKEILARMIHDTSRAKKGAFVPFNCAATPRELVESQLFGHRRGAFTGATESFQGLIRGAEKGTLFLDEIGDLEPAAQPKFLRFLESGEIHPVGDLRPQHVAVRVVAATNANLEQLVEQGRFRSDLFYRIGVAKLALPPLRERKDEIPALASVFLTRHAKECHRAGLKLSDDFIAALLLYDWPGNIRELSNEIRRVVAMAGDGDTISSADLSPVITARWDARVQGTPERSIGPSVQVRLDQTLSEAVRDLEARFIEHAMRITSGRVAEAAQLLGLSRKGLFLKRRRNGSLARPEADAEPAYD